MGYDDKRFRPLTGHGFYPCLRLRRKAAERCFRPLTGHGFYLRWASIIVFSQRFRPLTGHGFYPHSCWRTVCASTVSVPLRGMGFIGMAYLRRLRGCLFPSPYGAWVLSVTVGRIDIIVDKFPSPYGAWVLSTIARRSCPAREGFRPLTGHGFYHFCYGMLFSVKVSVPLRGMGFIAACSGEAASEICFRPLTGHGFYLCIGLL